MMPDPTPTPDPGIYIASIGGQCPVEAEGTVDGEHFYFRSRGARWSLGIGGEIYGDPIWQYSEAYGTWPDAGWITEDQARRFIALGAAKWRAGRPAAACETRDDPVCETCEGGGWVSRHSERPPAFEVCPSCHNPGGNPCP